MCRVAADEAGGQKSRTAKFIYAKLTPAPCTYNVIQLLFIFITLTRQAKCVNNKKEKLFLTRSKPLSYLL